MKHPADVIEALEGTNSRLEKEAIILEAWQNGMLEFFHGVQSSLDAMTTYGIKKVPLIELQEDEVDDGPAPGSFSYEDFKILAAALSTRKITGHAARDAVIAAAERCNTREWNLWYRRLLLKDLNAGCSETTINTVLKKQASQGKAFLVPVFACQLAKDGADMIDKLKGKYLCDFKGDGVRILTILDKGSNTVQQYTRNGALNENFPHITEGLAKILPLLKESIVLDGEMMSKSFQSLMKQVNRKDNVDTKDASLMLFDIIPLKAFREGEYKVGQRDRHLALCEMQSMLGDATDGAVYVLPKIEIDFDTEEGRTKFNEFNREALDNLFEGIMIKDPKAPYRTKRSADWSKLKPTISVDLEIIGVEPGERESKYQNTMGKILCKGEDHGKEIEVSVGSGFSDELRDEIWNQREAIIGRIVEIKADAVTKSANSETYSLRFPRFLTFRGFLPGEKF